MASTSPRPPALDRSTPRRKNLQLTVLPGIITVHALLYSIHTEAEIILDIPLGLRDGMDQDCQVDYHYELYASSKECICAIVHVGVGSLNMSSR